MRGQRGNVQLSQKGREAWGCGAGHGGGAGWQHLSHTPRLEGAGRLAWSHDCSFPTLLLVFPPRPWPCGRAGVRHSGAALALLFHEVNFPNPGSAGAGLPRPQPAPLRLNLTGAKPPLPRPPSYRAHTTRAKSGFPTPPPPATGAVKADRAHRGQGAGPTCAPPLPGLTCPSWRRAPGRCRAVAEGLPVGTGGWAQRLRLQPRRAAETPPRPGPGPGGVGGSRSPR